MALSPTFHDSVLGVVFCGVAARCLVPVSQRLFDYMYASPVSQKLWDCPCFSYNYSNFYLIFLMHKLLAG